MDQRAFASDVIVKSMIEQGRWHGETYFRHWQSQEAIPVSDEHFMIRAPGTARLLGMGTITRDISAARKIAAEREQLLAREQAARQETERVNAQLRESEERFRLTIDEAPIGMALVSLDGRFVRVNRVLCEIVGYTAEELMRLTFQAITHRDDLETDEALAGRLAQGEIPQYQLEKRYSRKDGSIVNVMLSGSILRGTDGAPLYYIAQIEDITQRKRLEESLRLSEAKSSGILSISADAIISIDEEQRIISFNDGAEKIFGFSKAEAIGAPLEILIPHRFRAIHREHVAHFSAGHAIARRMGQRETPIFGLRKNLFMHVPLDPAHGPLIGRVLRDRETTFMPEFLQRELVSFGEEAQRAIRAADLKSVIATPLMVHGKIVGVITFICSSGSRRYGLRDVRIAEELAQRAALSIENARLFSETQLAGRQDPGGCACGGVARSEEPCDHDEAGRPYISWLRRYRCQ